MTVKHAFTNATSDRAGYTGTKPSHWNADHTITGFIPGGVTAASVSSTYAMDCSLGNRWVLSLVDAVTLSITNATIYQEITVTIIQDATGGRAVAWPTTFKGAMDIPTPAFGFSAANAIATQKFMCYDGTNWVAVGPGTVN